MRKGWALAAAAVLLFTAAGCETADAEPLAYETAAGEIRIEPDGVPGGEIRLLIDRDEDGQLRPCSLTVVSPAAAAGVTVRFAPDGSGELQAGETVIPLSAAASAGLRLWADVFTLHTREDRAFEAVSYNGTPATAWWAEDADGFVRVVIRNADGKPLWVEGCRNGFSVAGRVLE